MWLYYMLLLNHDNTAVAVEKLKKGYNLLVQKDKKNSQELTCQATIHLTAAVVQCLGYIW